MNPLSAHINEKHLAWEIASTFTFVNYKSIIFLQNYSRFQMSLALKKGFLKKFILRGVLYIIDYSSQSTSVCSVIMFIKVSAFIFHLLGSSSPIKEGRLLRDFCFNLCFDIITVLPQSKIYLNLNEGYSCLMFGVHEWLQFCQTCKVMYNCYVRESRAKQELTPW